jgi:hypothetical protein
MKLAKLIFTALLSFTMLDETPAQTLVRRDDFQNKKNYWFWRADGTAEAPHLREGLAEIKLVDPVNTTYCNAEIMDPENLFRYRNVRMRVKAAVPKKPGSRGWGWWHTGSPSDEDFFDLAWYVDQSDSLPQSDLTWFRLWAGTSMLSVTYKDMELYASPETWHLYEVKWSQEGVSYWLDEALIHNETTHVPDAGMSFHIWVDNKIYSLSGQTQHFSWTGESTLLIDFVEYTTADQTGTSYPASGSVKLREIPNQIGWGEGEYPWKSYAYKSPGGQTLVLVHGRAEHYENLSDPDALKITVDGEDFGWDPDDSFNGDHDQGQIKTLALPIMQAAGNHTINLRARMTPTLYDVTVIGDTNGEVVLLDTLTEIAGAGTNHLWKQYDFISAAGYFSFYIAGWADEDTTGEQKIEFDDDLDDDLMIQIDEMSYGWKNEYAFYGNELFGEGKSIVIQRWLEQGDHSLQLWTNHSPGKTCVLIYRTDQEPAPIKNKDEKIGIPGQTILHDNYPNPFNSGTNISFELESTKEVILSVYDILGQKVDRIFKGRLGPGRYNLHWPGKDDSGRAVNSGVYYYQIQTGSTVLTKKMLLLQ